MERGQLLTAGHTGLGVRAAPRHCSQTSRVPSKELYQFISSFSHCQRTSGRTSVNPGWPRQRNECHTSAEVSCKLPKLG